MSENTKTELSSNATGDNDPDRAQVWGMFDRIAHRYDLLNRLLSFGQDVLWRNRVARSMVEKPKQRVLDLATGTCDLLFALDATGKVEEGLGIDMSTEMLRFGEQKIKERNLTSRLSVKVGDATDVPEEDGLYDLVTISFGIRNVIDVPKAMKEMYRILKPGGRVLILEFSLPGNTLIRNGYLFYFRNILPIIGGLISGDSYAYRYLNETVETFPYGEEFHTLMRDAGFSAVSGKEQTFGVATIYQGEKPNEA